MGMPPLIEKAERARQFARAIASDLAMYNEAKLAQGIQDDTLFDLMKDEIEEGRTHFKSRVTPEIATPISLIARWWTSCSSSAGKTSNRRSGERRSAREYPTRTPSWWRQRGRTAAGLGARRRISPGFPHPAHPPCVRRRGYGQRAGGGALAQTAGRRGHRVDTASAPAQR
jgi:hypothetical protein